MRFWQEFSLYRWKKGEGTTITDLTTPHDDDHGNDYGDSDGDIGAAVDRLRVSASVQ